MIQQELTDRQKREKNYYEEFCERTEPVKVCFDPILGKEKRPWNPYWFTYETALNYYRHEGQRLLDFGCGKGASSIVFAKIGYEVYGFDISESSISIAKKLAKEHGFEDRTHFSVKIAEQLNYPSDFFDVIVGIDILHHLEIKQAANECFRLLRKGGIAIFREPIEVPVFDKVRNSRFGTWLVPKERSFKRHITEDEKKLAEDDIACIKTVFANTAVERFTLFSRIDPFFRKPNEKRPTLLGKVDYALFRVFPVLKNFGGNAVLLLRKD